VGHIPERQVRARVRAAAHLLQPAAEAHVDGAARVQRGLHGLARPGGITALLALAVQDRQHLRCDGDRDVRDELVRVGEGRRGQLVVLRERALENVEADLARVRQHHVRDVRACVVDREHERRRLPVC
jgi:hypothetical protein